MSRKKTYTYQTGKKMKPYGRKEKYRLENEFREGEFPRHIGKDKKEEIRNANRSLKKSERQQAKKEIRKYL